MPAKKKANIDHVVGIDIGTSKIICVVAELNDAGELTIIGVGKYPSLGLKRGVVVNIEATVESIQKAVEQAEEMAKYPIRHVYAGIAGSHIKGFNSHGIVAISASEVIPSDVDRVIDAARAVAIPADQKILHILPQEFTIDQQDGIKEPVGMSGVRLEAKVHIVTGAVSAAQNIEKCVRQCGLMPEDIILEQLASSYAVLSDDEKDLGVCMVDIGGGTTDVAIFTRDAIRHTSVIPIAGDQVSSDIAIAFRTPTRNAEQMKIQHGVCLMEQASSDQPIDIGSVADRAPKQTSELALAQIIQPRYEELLNLVKADIRRSGFEELIPSGIVLTGGASKVTGLLDLAEQVFQMPVRIGKPEGVYGMEDIVNDPSYATAIGLLHYGKKHNFHPAMHHNKPKVSMFSRMKQWFQGNM